MTLSEGNIKDEERLYLHKHSVSPCQAKSSIGFLMK